MAARKQIEKLDTNSPYLKAMYSRVCKYDNAARLYAALNNLTYYSLPDIWSLMNEDIRLRKEEVLKSNGRQFYTRIDKKIVLPTIDILKVYIPKFNFFLFARIAACILNLEIVLVTKKPGSNIYESRSFFPEKFQE